VLKIFSSFRPKIKAKEARARNASSCIRNCNDRADDLGVLSYFVDCPLDVADLSVCAQRIRAVGPLTIFIRRVYET
jgi:hypothetical protein